MSWSSEAEWRQCKDVSRLLRQAERLSSPHRPAIGRRKARLVACAIARLLWQYLDDDTQKLVAVAELFADGGLGERELQVARPRAIGYFSGEFFDIVGHVGDSDCWSAAYRTAERVDSCPIALPQSAIPNIIRDVFGNPFRLGRVDAVLAAAASMAAAIYAERAFECLPILGDALEEAGCSDAEVLEHCRTPGLHVRGCWVVDLVLGKD